MLRGAIPEPVGAHKQGGGVSRGVWIVGGIALLLIVAGIGLGVGLGLPGSKSNGNNSNNSSRTPSGTPSSVTNGTTTPGAPSTGPGSTFTPTNSTTDPAGTTPPPAIDSAEALNATELPLAALDQFVASLNETAVATEDPNWQALVELIEDNRGMFLLYLRNRKLNDVLAYLQATQKDAEGVTGADARRARAALLSSINFADFKRWLKGNDRTTPALTPSQLEALKAFEPYISEEIKAEFGEGANTTTGPDLRDPIVQLQQFSERLQAAGLDFTTMLNPEFFTAVAKGVGNRKLKAASALPPLGHTWFKPTRIGLIFHVMQFPINGTSFYPGSSPRVRNQFTNIVAAANRFFMLSGTNIQFYIKELRIDVTEYSYLAMESLSDWQGCAQQRQDCLCLFGREYNEAPDTYVNIWVSGLLQYMEEAVVAYSSSLPPVLDTCAGVLADATSPSIFSDEIDDPTDLAFDPINTPAAQHLWMIYDNLALQSVYNRSYYDGGGATLAHELGHFLGLMHTHDSGCIATDFVADTPPNLLIDSQPFTYTKLAPWCRALRQGQAMSMNALKIHDSCTKDDKYIDNVFNLMSYSPNACQLYFTAGQVERMQRISTVYRKKMLQAA